MAPGSAGGEGLEQRKGAGFGKSVHHKRHEKHKTASDFTDEIRSFSDRQMQSLNLFCVTFTAALLVGSAVSAQPEVIRCLAPEVPITDLPEAVLAEYRSEISAEFEAYFAAVGEHIACLDAERDRALTEAQEATQTYSTFLSTIPAQKDLP